MPSMWNGLFAKSVRQLEGEEDDDFIRCRAGGAVATLLNLGPEGDKLASDKPVGDLQKLLQVKAATDTAFEPALAQVSKLVQALMGRRVSFDRKRDVQQPSEGYLDDPDMDEAAMIAQWQLEFAYGEQLDKHILPPLDGRVVAGRPMFALSVVADAGSKIVKLPFAWHSGSEQTVLTPLAFKALGIEPPAGGSMATVSISGASIQVRTPLAGSQRSINILGADWCVAAHATMTVDYLLQTARIERSPRSFMSL